MLINKILNIQYPIIQGAMANIATGKFAAAVSNAGGLGIIGTGAMDPDTARKSIRECKSLTDKPFGVNVMLKNPYKDEIMKVIIEEGVPVVTTGAGSPGIYIKDLKENGIKIIPVVPSVALAIRMEKAGVDMIIAEGGEAGGHVGETTTMALIPQIKDAISIPLIAAGGIGDARGFNAALSLGADGVQLGTSLLVAKECDIHQNYKKAIINAKDTDSTVTGRSINLAVRVLKNKMSNKYLNLEKTMADPLEMEKLTLGSLRKAVIEGDIVNGSIMAGQIAGLIKEEKDLKEIFHDIVYGSKVELNNLINKIEEL